MKSRTLLSASIIVACLAGVVLFCAKKSPTSVEEKDFTGKITGQVLSKINGLPVKDVLVSIDADSATPGVTNSSGIFMVGRVSAGEHTLHFTHRDFEDTNCYTVKISRGEEKAMTDTVRLSYRYYIIKGTVVNNSGKSPVPGAGVAVGNTPISSLTNINGSFVLDRISKEAPVELICAKSGFGFHEQMVTNLVSNDTTRLVAILLDREGATVSGTVYDSTGKPMGNIVVAAVGGGVADTTDAQGRYTLDNVPSSSNVRIFVPDETGYSGGLTGFTIHDSALVTGMDIYLRSPATLAAGNGMALVVNDVLVIDTGATAKLSVYPTTAVNTVITGYEWTIPGASRTCRQTTTAPVLALPLDTLEAIAGGATSFDLKVTVLSTNDEGAKSQAQTFTVMVRSTKPQAVAKASSTPAGIRSDTIRITQGATAYLFGTGTDPFGGIDTLEWSFGDGQRWFTTDSSGYVEYPYDSVGTLNAIFRCRDVEGNIARDTVTVIVAASALPAPVLVSPADGDTNRATIDSVTLVWRKVTAASSYTVYLDSRIYPPSQDSVEKTGLTDTALRVAIDSGKTYSWKVASVKGAERTNSTPRKYYGRRTTAADTTGLKKGLVAWYPFNGNAKDESGNGNDGTLCPTCLASDRFNRGNSSLLFATLNDSCKISITGLPDSQKARTISLWIKADVSNKRYYLLHYGGIGTTSTIAGSAFSIGYFYQNIPGFTGRGLVVDVAHRYYANDINLEKEWQHIAAVYENGQMKIFKNNSISLNLPVNLDTRLKSATIPLLIGSSWDGSPENAFIGLIDDIRIYNRALTPAEIDSLYHEEGWTGNSITYTDSVTDIDGNKYHAVTIGTQTWLVENLRVTKYNDGTPIPNVMDEAAWAALTTPAYCYFDNADSNKATYGVLYNWYTVDPANPKKIAPPGWHVPTDAEWTVLTTFLGGESVAGGKLKEAGLAHWLSPNMGATNETGFSALPGEYRHFVGSFAIGVGGGGFWWSSTADGTGGLHGTVKCASITRTCTVTTTEGVSAARFGWSGTD